MKAGQPLISVVIATFNRSDLLRQSLSSFKRQTLNLRDFEIIVLDDGSTDSTREVVDSLSSVLPIKYFHQRNSGIAAAKNHGLFVATGNIVFFFDDDDLATKNLLEQHLKTHREHPEENIGVLNYTRWRPDMKVTPLMEFITGEGGLLFSYPLIRPGQLLDFTFFWGGRASCKRTLLVRKGIFNPVFRFGDEDAELGFRLAPQGFKVIFNKKAVSYMNRPVGFDEFVHRCRRQGQAHYLWSSMTDDPWVREWCLINRFPHEWPNVKTTYADLLDYARKLDGAALAKAEAGFPLNDAFRTHLHDVYGKIFLASKIKGVQEAIDSQDNRPLSDRVRPLGYRSGVGKKPSFTVMAIICVYNEGDVIYHVLKHLIENDILVYLLDHHSADNTIEEASKWLGRGLVHIERFPEESGCPEADKDIFSLRQITRRVEQLHRTLAADWYIHYDADEFREPPWPGMTLKEAIHLVDVLGFNAINFEYLNFWPTDNSFVPGEDVRNFIRHYEPAEDWDKPRVNAWKNIGQEIDLTAFMGHKVCFPGIRVFPLQFINRHYRIRSQEHGCRKVFRERIARFDPLEKAGGSHLHYDTLRANCNFIKDPKEVTRYQADRVRERLAFKAAFNAGKF
jgi:glycosyltransferase involved in cell wall biosynthesis